VAYNSGTVIKIIDINENKLDYNKYYDISFLRTLKPVVSDIHTHSYTNDILAYSYEYINFLKEYNIKFQYPELYILTGAEFENAFWNETYLTLGNGIKSRSRPFASAAIIGHELTHAVIQSMNKLHYIGESGSLNESYCDIFGVMFESYLIEKNRTGIGFEFGNEIYVDGHSMRSFIDPNKCGQPCSVSDKMFYKGRSDHGGVHINSGITNHLFYRLQIHLDKCNTFEIFLNVLNKLKNDSTFNDFKKLIIQEIPDKIDIINSIL
jgi:Zn-dependent metalloprotease